jgi:hypothetical protein
VTGRPTNGAHEPGLRSQRNTFSSSR